MVTRDRYIYHPFLQFFYFVLAKRKSWSHFDPEKRISLLEMFIAFGNDHLKKECKPYSVAMFTQLQFLQFAACVV